MSTACGLALIDACLGYISTIIIVVLIVISYTALLFVPIGFVDIVNACTEYIDRYFKTDYLIFSASLGKQGRQHNKALQIKDPPSW